jgi:MATE family multidrug resistance protein
MSNPGPILETTRRVREEPDAERVQGCDSRSLASRWFLGECGGNEVLRLALPLVVSTVSFALMHFCNRLFLTWYSTVSVAAVIQAGALAWVFYSFPLGLAMYTTTFVAQYHGARQYHNVGRIVWQAVWIGLACLPLFIVAGWHLPILFRWLGHSPGMLAEEYLYFRISLFGLGAGTIAEAFAAYFVGVGRTRVVMWVNGSASLLNIALDYLLIFGWGPIPEMGIAGAATATTLAVWFKLALYAAIVMTTADRRRHRLIAGWGFNRNLTGRLLRFGAPQGFHFLLEGGAITFFIMLMGGISDLASAATAIAFSANLVAFVPVMGLGSAVTTLVGREIGRQRIGLAQRATHVGLSIGIVYSAVFAFLYAAFPVLFVGMHEAMAGLVKPEVTAARWMLKFVAAYCIFDAIQLLFQAALKGAGDTRYIMLTSVVLSTLFVISGSLGARWSSTDDAEILWWWWMLTLWVIGLAAAFAWRYWMGNWQSMKVIEPGTDEPVGTRQPGASGE